MKTTQSLFQQLVKLLLLATIIVGSVSFTNAQSLKIGGEDEFKKDEIKTLFGDKKRRNGFYGGFGFGYSPIDGKGAMVLSGRGGWIIDHSFAIGLGGSSFVNNMQSIDVWNEQDNEYHLGGGYGGLILEPIIAPRKPIHISIPILLGMGAASSFQDFSEYEFLEYVPLYTDFFFVAEPGIELEVNLTSYFRIAAYCNYRITSKLNIKDVSPSALNSYAAGLTFKFGIF